MGFLDECAEFVRRHEPLAPYTSLRIGGAADVLAQPRSVDELVRLLDGCRNQKLQVRVLGGGRNVLVRDDGVPGVVVRLCEPAFCQIQVEDRHVRVGAGCRLSALISEAARHSLAGIESLIGIPGTVGGAIRTNAGSRSMSIGQLVRQVDILDRDGNIRTCSLQEIPSGPQGILLEDALLLAAEFDLEPGDADSILRRLRRFWIHRKANQPLSFQASARVFRDPRGQTATELIEQAGLVGTRVGGAEVCERNANYVIAHPGTTARDVLQLIDLIRSRVQERSGVRLQLELVVW